MVKKILLSILIIFLMLLSINSFGKSNYEEVDFSTGIVTANILNVRAGPGLNYDIISQITKDEYIRVFAKIDNWYIVQTESDFVGTVSADYIIPIYQENNSTTEVGTELTNDENEVYELINEQRVANGLQALAINNELQNVARIKAQDMVNGDYFSHTSPNYGSPFDMLKKFSISYRTAGENIAGNGTNTGAVNAWMNSEGHKENILNNSYNYTGIAVVDSPKYGKIYVQIFIGR